MAINGEAIYNTKPWIVQNDTSAHNVWYTQKKNEKHIYALILRWPENGILYLKSLKVSINAEIHMLGFAQSIDVCHINFECKIPTNNMVHN